MNRDRSTYTSTSDDTCSVRPRNRRLVSYSDEDALPNEAAGSSTTWSQSKPNTSPVQSRDISPIPGTRLSRPPSLTKNPASVNSGSYRTRSSNFGQINSPSTLGWWESWSSLQSVASTLLGSDAQDAAKRRNDSGSANSFWSKASKSLGSGPGAPQWGPKTDAEQFTFGSNEKRQAMLQAKKREALLLADPNGLSNPTAPHKRRDSDLRPSNSATHAEQDGDALVYVHKVKPQDTVAGVMIRYQCQPAVFRKVNRLWPNDNIQVREHVFLPVEACAVRGRKIDPTTTETSHISSAVEQSTLNSSNHFSLPPDNASSFPPAPNPSSNPPDPEHKHEYYVSIPGIPENVEIARIPRRTLGFFPPSRRKSQSFSDMDPYSDSPKTSLDLSSRPHPHNLPLNTSPPSSSSRTRTQQLRPRNRSNSNSNLGKYFLGRLKGPGGVGTLRGGGPGGGVVTPGPAEDSLNKMFAHRLPNVAPPTTLPRDSFDSVRSTSSTGLENVGGAIEGWVRRVGGRLVGLEGWDGKHGGLGMGRMGLGDLIELEDSGGDNQTTTAEDLGGSSPRNEGVVAASGEIISLDGPADGMNSRDVGRGGISATEEALLRERFPSRGRMVHAQTLQRR